MLDSAWSSDDLPALGAPTNATCAAPSRRTEIESRRVKLAVDPLADVRVRAAAVVRQLGEDRAQLADPLRAFLADESALDQLHLGAMGHGHRGTPPWVEPGQAGRAARRNVSAVASCPAASLDA